MSDYLHAKTENVQKLLDNCLKKQKQEIISEFVKRIDDVIGECQNYTQYFEELIMMKEYYEEKR